MPWCSHLSALKKQTLPTAILGKFFLVGIIYRVTSKNMKEWFFLDFTRGLLSDYNKLITQLDITTQASIIFDQTKFSFIPLDKTFPNPC